MAEMFWWFERSGRYVRCETRFIAKGSYEFVITQPDGTERVEHFTDAEAMTRRRRRHNASSPTMDGRGRTGGTSEFLHAVA